MVGKGSEVFIEERTGAHIPREGLLKVWRFQDPEALFVPSWAAGGHTEVGGEHCWGGSGGPGHLVPKHIPPMALRGTLLYLRMVQLQTEGQTPMDSWSVPPPQEELNFDTLRLPRFLAL